MPIPPKLAESMAKLKQSLDDSLTDEGKAALETLQTDLRAWAKANGLLAMFAIAFVGVEVSATLEEKVLQHQGEQG